MEINTMYKLNRLLKHVFASKLYNTQARRAYNKVPLQIACFLAWKVCPENYPHISWHPYYWFRSLI